MRSTARAVLAAVLSGFAAAVLALPEAPRPGPELARLDYFVGKWHSTGSMKAGPWGAGGAMAGDDDCQKMPGGFFVVCRSEGSGPMGAIHGLGVMGYDAQKKVYTWNGFNSMGEHESAAGTIAGKVWTYTGEQSMGGPTFQTRYTITEGTPTSYDFRAETSQDGKTWTVVMDGRVTKK